MQQIDQEIPVIPQPILPVGAQNNIVAVAVPDVDSSVMTVFGQSVKKTYFYLFMIVIIAVLGYFIWKWYSNRGKDSKSDKKDKGSKNDKQYDDSSSGSYSEDDNENDPQNRPPPAHIQQQQYMHKMNQELMKKLTEQNNLIEQMKQQLAQQDDK